MGELEVIVMKLAFFYAPFKRLPRFPGVIGLAALIPLDWMV